MPEFTPYMNLYKPGGGSTGTIVPDEIADIDRLNQNFDLIDAEAKKAYQRGTIIVANAAERNGIPSPINGMSVYRLDTKRIEIFRSGAWTSSNWGTVPLDTASGWSGFIDICCPDGLTVAIRGQINSRALSTGFNYPAVAGAVPAPFRTGRHEPGGSGWAATASTGQFPVSAVAMSDGGIGIVLPSAMTAALFFNITYPLE